MKAFYRTLRKLIEDSYRADDEVHYFIELIDVAYLPPGLIIDETIANKLISSYVSTNKLISSYVSIRKRIPNEHTAFLDALKTVI